MRLCAVDQMREQMECRRAVARTDTCCSVVCTDTCCGVVREQQALVSECVCVCARVSARAIAFKFVRASAALGESGTKACGVPAI